MKMMSPRDFNSVNVRLVRTAEAILRGELNLLSGVRALAALRTQLFDPDDEILVPILAIEDETDHFPVGSVRDQWAPEALEKLDRELEHYLEQEREVILQACAQIIKVYSADPPS